MRNRGQALPLTLMLLPLLALLLVLGMEELHLKREKIHLQRQVDSLTLMVTTEQARSLNGIAVLNEGLHVIRNRVSLYKVARVTVAVCAFLNAFCARTLIQLEANWHRRFKPSVIRFGKNVKAAQDALLRWGAVAPQRIIQAYNIHQASRFLGSSDKEIDAEPPAWAFLYPFDEESERMEDTLKLHVFRSSEKPPGEYDDHVSCKKPIYYFTWEDFEHRRGGIRPEPPNQFFTTYHPSHSEEGSRVRRRISSLEELHTLRKMLRLDGVSHFFRSASYQQCLRASDWGKGDLLPGPVVADADFMEHQKLNVILMSLPRESIFAPIFEAVRLEHKTRQANWAIAEAETPLMDMESMEFRPRLTPVSRHEAAFASLEGRIPGHFSASEILGKIDEWTRIDIPSLPIPGSGILDTLASLFGVHLSISLPTIEFPHMDALKKAEEKANPFARIRIPRKEDYEALLLH